jgi:hypothetical protein
MSGGLKSGLIFGAIALVIAVGFSFIPLAGPFCCGPLGIALLGGVAGYVGTRWNPAHTIGQGTLAGGLAGVGGLIGTVLFFIIIAVMAANMPEYEALIEEQLRQQPEVGLTANDMRGMMGVIIPIMGVCIGLFGLVCALGCGALGGYIARGQEQPADTGMPPTSTV